MKKIIFNFLFLIPLGAYSQTQPNDSAKTLSETINSKNDSNHVTIPKQYTLEGGTLVRIRLLNEVNSKTAKEGDIIDFIVFEDVTLNNKIIIKENSKLNGTVEKVEKAKGLGKAGELSYSLNYVKAIDGTKVYLKTSKANMEGQDRTGGAIAMAVVLSPLFLLHKGKNVKMDSGKVIQVYTDRDYKINITE